MILRTRALSWAGVSPRRLARGRCVRRAVVTITLEPTDTAHGVNTRGIPRDAPADTGLRAPRGAVSGERRPPRAGRPTMSRVPGRTGPPSRAGARPLPARGRRATRTH